MLEVRGCETEIPSGRRLQVVRMLGRNPRALKALVAYLSFGPVDELIDLETKNRDLEDEILFPILSEGFERRLCNQIFNRLSPASVLLMQFLTVFRKPFTNAALEHYALHVSDIVAARHELINLFFLDHHRHWYSLNHVSRGLALARLKREPGRLVEAHSLAADYYMRYFQAKQGVNLAAHAREFVEVRYHLANSGRADEFTEIASRYRNYLLVNVGRLRTFPQDPDEKTQLVAALSAALSEDQLTHVESRYLLARLLVESDRVEDKRRALREVTLSCLESSDPAVWELRVRLSAQLESPAATYSITRQAQQALSEDGLVDFYNAIAREVARKSTEAKELVNQLNDAMHSRAADPQAWKLCQVTADVLARHDSHNEAISVLRCYLSKAVGIKDGGRLLEKALLLAYAKQQPRALLDIESLIGDDVQRRMLLNVLWLLLKNDFEEAARSVNQEEGIADSVAIQAAFAELCRGYPSKAKKYLSELDEHYNRPRHWLRSLISLSLGDIEEARIGLAAYLEMDFLGPEPLNLATWVSAWDESIGPLDSNASFLFPKLPAVLTGLDYDLVRLQDTKNIVDAATLEMLSFRPRRMSDDAVRVDYQVSDPSVDTVINARPTLVNVVNVSQEGISMGDKNVVGQAAAVGSHATASNVTLQQLSGFGDLSGMDMHHVAQDLERLRIALRELPSSDDNDEALAEISRAARAAVQGDEAKVVSHLRGAGQWALRTANAIGASVAAAAITKAIGM